ncbi:MAG: hypothetical protein C4529_00005, partial [Deltaproteobacteria bacterium]
MENNSGDRRTGVAAVEGGKGRGSWDGVERRKSRAVIGIPYSSDAAGHTEAEGEEKVMKSAAKYMIFAGVAAAVAVALSACGG